LDKVAGRECFVLGEEQKSLRNRETCCWRGLGYMLLACHGIKFVRMVEFQSIQYGSDESLEMMNHFLMLPHVILILN
jgi:hypothetical protein